MNLNLFDILADILQGVKSIDFGVYVGLAVLLWIAIMVTIQTVIAMNRR